MDKKTESAVKQIKKLENDLKKIDDNTLHIVLSVATREAQKRGLL